MDGRRESLQGWMAHHRKSTHAMTAQKGHVFWGFWDRVWPGTQRLYLWWSWVSRGPVVDIITGMSCKGRHEADQYVRDGQHQAEVKNTHTAPPPPPPPPHIHSTTTTIHTAPPPPSPPPHIHSTTTTIKPKSRIPGGVPAVKKQALGRWHE